MQAATHPEKDRNTADWKPSGWRRKTIVLFPPRRAAMSGRKQTHVESRLH